MKFLSFLFIAFAITFPTVAKAELIPEAVAQVLQGHGCRGGCPPIGIRILKDGTVQQFRKDEWSNIALISADKMKELIRVTNVMVPKALYTRPNQTVLADGPHIRFVVRNAKGETVLIKEIHEYVSSLLQGGVLGLVSILDGFKSLVDISY